MTNVNNFNSLSELSQCEERYWQQFCELHQEKQQPLLTRLSTPQTALFKRALAVSDFIFNSACKYPELILPLFGELSESNVIDNSGELCPDYALLLKLHLQDCDTEEQLHHRLRKFRTQQMVNIALADMLLDSPLPTSLTRLSELADALIMGALQWLTDFCQQKWGQPQNAQGDEMPLLVYGMGKLGGKELNFSSDIDLIFVYPEIGCTAGARRSIDNQQFFIRLAQKLIAALDTVTVDGFVYRVDMRLRPFGESGPLVLTFNAMEDYYQEQGRDWERYAMLKARLIGNSAYHGKLSAMLRPFVYRRYIDFSAIESLRRMKMMIAQEVRRKQLINNIKLGAGGIREIEFIVQVFQLIRGGRIKALQERSLLTVLPLLVEYNIINSRSCEVLTSAYCFLRRVENIMQAIADHQTQTLPEKTLDQQRLLYVLKIATWQDFLSQLEQHMQAVHHEFNLLIGEESPNHQAKDQQWQVCWALLSQPTINEETQEQFLALLTQLAPHWQIDLIAEQLIDFNLEVNKRGVGRRGRQILDKLIPLLMWHLVAAKYQQETLTRVLVILTTIASRTAYLELLYENEGALKQLNRLCAASAWLAEHIAKYPLLLDELIDPTILNNPPDLNSYYQHLRETMLRVPEDDLEAQMETLRQFKQAQHLRIAAGDITGVLPLIKVSDHLTALAEAIINEVIALAWQQVSKRFGIPKSLCGKDHKGFAVIGYGKLGGFELSYGSDLDLVFVHDSPEGEVTNGEKSIAASQFYSKLAQRMMHIFNTRMNNGILYELDMRLRPSGNSGVLVVHINTFAQYQQQDAWTWEHQALVRARVVYGHQHIKDAFQHIRQEILCKARDISQLTQEVHDMREKMRAHLDKSSGEYFDIKQANGGLVDIEFLVQFWVLAYSHQFPKITTYSDNLRLLRILQQCNLITSAEQQLLSNAYIALRDLGHSNTLANIDNSYVMLNEQLKKYTQQVKCIYQKYLL